MRTDWAGPSMTIHDVSPAYEPTVGAVVGMLRGTLVQQAAGDPAKVADVVLAVADLDEPPVRLLLGSDAVGYVAELDKARAESDARWRELSVSTDYADLSETSLDPMASLRS